MRAGTLLWALLLPDATLGFQHGVARVLTTGRDSKSVALPRTSRLVAFDDTPEEVLVPVTLASAATLAAACTSACFAAPALWAAFAKVSVSSSALSAFGGGAAVASGFSTAFYAIARPVVEEAEMDAYGSPYQYQSRSGPVVASTSGFATAIACAAAVAFFSSPAIWSASTSAFTAATVPSTTMSAFLGASFAFSSSCAFAFSSIAQATSDDAEMGINRARGRVAGIPIAISSSAALAAGATAICFASPALWSAVTSSSISSTAMSSFGGGAAAAFGFSFAYFAIGRQAIEDAEMNMYQYRARASIPSSIDSTTGPFAAGCAAVAAFVASPAIWTSSTKAFTAATVSSSSFASFLGASFAFAASAAYAFAVAGRAVEDAEYDALQYGRSYGRTGQRRVSSTRGSSAFERTAGNSGFTGDMRMADNTRYARTSRDPIDSRFNRGNARYRANSRPGNTPRDRVATRVEAPFNRGTIVPTDPRLGEPKDATWRMTQRPGGRIRR